MASDEKESADSPAGTPKAPDDAQERSLAGYATIVGVVTGLFGMLLGVGFILLPAATMQEKLLIIGACLAVSAAGATGAGARRSPRGFGPTMVAGGLAIACLADLSIAAADGAKATTVASGSHQAARTARPSVTSGAPAMPSLSSSPTPTPTLSASSTPRVTQSGQSVMPSPPDSSTETTTSQPGTVYLSNLQDSADTGAPQARPWTVDGVSYSHSLFYTGNQMCVPNGNSVTYDLSGSYDNFRAEVGVAGSSSTDQGTPFSFTVNWGTSPASSRSWGTPPRGPGIPIR